MSVDNAEQPALVVDNGYLIWTGGDAPHGYWLPFRVRLTEIVAWELSDTDWTVVRVRSDNGRPSYGIPGNHLRFIDEAMGVTVAGNSGQEMSDLPGCEDHDPQTDEVCGSLRGNPPRG